MAKEKNKRYQKAEHLLTELKNIDKGLPTTDKFLPEIEFEREAPRKHLIPWVLLFVAIITIGGYLFYDKVLRGEKSGQEKSTIVAGPTTQETPALTPQPGFMEINSVPEGADVYVDNKLEGITPIKLEVSPRTYKIRIKKDPEYKEMTADLEVYAERTSLKSFTLDAVYFLEVKTIPKGADVRIDGNHKGKTPIKVELLSSICQLRIEKGKEWSYIDESLTLNPGINSFDRSLKRIRYSLSIKTYPPESRVSIGGELIGTTPLKKMDLFGNYSIKIEKEGYKTIEEPITVESDIEKTYDLIKLEPKVGKIILKVHPYANVYIDGELIGEVPPSIIQEVKEGKYTIEFISKKLNKKITVEVEIRGEETKEVRMNMETGKKEIVKLNSKQ